MMGKKDLFAAERHEMVGHQVRSRGVSHEETLKSLEAVPRHLFVPPDERGNAYGDYPLPIGHGQTISQPYIVGLMTELLGPDRSSRILEIGTGSGYQTAVLAGIVQEVFTVERIKELLDNAERVLKENGYENIRYRYGNGYEGWREYAPYDGIIVTAAPEEVPPMLMDQLKDGGKLVVPVGGPFEQVLMRYTREGKRFNGEIIAGVRFVKLVNNQ